ncbi:MAG TPA: dNTP triphosphohydrolase [Candidatus Gracilibacteria bacterium]
MDGQNLIKPYDALLKPYAQKHGNSLGRVYPTDEDRDRLPYQRDRDRIIHCSSFRRLRGKRQVVSPSLGDHFRNRLSHTLEVSQIARDIARQLGLNEDLCEAIALSHDLGHPPFGHDGEKTLHEKMQSFGKNFEHNVQSLRVVETLETRYRDFPGLNLSYEVREGLQKHTKGFVRPDGSEVVWPSLESQLVDISDEMAYLAADLEDALRAGFIAFSDLKQVPVCADILKDGVIGEDRSTFNRYLLHVLISRLVGDIEFFLSHHHIVSQVEAQQSPDRLIRFQDDFESQFLALKAYMFEHFYLRDEVMESSRRGQKLIADLFDYFLSHPNDLPATFQSAEPIEERICDYIAGMTDEYAFKVHESKLI